MALRKHSGWTTEALPDGQLSVSHTPSPLEVTISDDGVYDIEFSDGELGLVLETDFYGQHAIVRGVNAKSPVGRLNLVQEGDVLVAVNETVVLHERFQNIIRYISTLKQQKVSRRLRFLNPLQCPVAMYEEKLQLNRKDQKDMYGFHRTLEHLLAERQHLGANMQKFAQRDLEWFHYVREIGGIQNLKSHGSMKPSPELKTLVRRGVPVVFRPRVWPHLCGAHQKRQRYPRDYYQTLVARTVTELDPKVCDDVEKDVSRTFPEHAMFHSREGLGALRKLLLAYALHNPDVGYCQSLNFIAGMMLLFMDQEDAFWLISAIVEDLLPPDYYSKSMTGSHIDQHVFARLIEQKLPKLHRHLERSHVHLPLVTLQWFLCLYVNTLPTETVLRVWDMFFNEGDKVLFRIAVGLLKIHESKLLSTRVETGELFMVMRELGREVVDADLLIASSYKIKKVQRGKPRPLETMSSMSLEDLEGFQHHSGDDRAATRDAITDSDLGETELERTSAQPDSAINTQFRATPSVPAGASAAAAVATGSGIYATRADPKMSSPNSRASVSLKSKKKRSFLAREDYRSISREGIRQLREQYGIEVEEKMQMARQLREQWQRDEAAGLHTRGPPGNTRPYAATPETASVVGTEKPPQEPPTPTLVDAVVSSGSDSSRETGVEANGDGVLIGLSSVAEYQEDSS